AWQRANESLPDVDDAAVALTALAPVLERTTDADRANRIRRAAEVAMPWVLGMQNRDGGWGAFVCGLAERSPDTCVTDLPHGRPGDPAALAALLVEPPAALGDPSVEDITGRVLHGLARFGLTTEGPAVQKAVEFLRAHQTAAGCWWGRWTGN